jgi:uncharacterized membrane protein
MTAGATQSSVITAASLNGFAGTVYLETFSYPLIVSLSSTSLVLSSGGTATDTLTVTAPSNTLPGNETIFVGASGGCTLVHFTDISARVIGPDFAISAEKTQMTIAQGGSDTSKINLASRNGFAGTVTLSSFGFPVTGTLAPGSVTLTSGGVGSSVLTVSASITVEPGNYSVFISASSGMFQHYLSVDVTVTGPTFAMSARQAFLTLLAGGATNSSTITVSPVGGFTGVVDLVAGSSFPSGLTVLLDKSSVSLPPAGIATLTLRAPPGTKTGGYFVDVSGTSGTIVKSVTVYVIVKGPDFLISPDPFFVTVVAGGSSCASTISVTPLYGFTGSVSLTKKADSVLTTTLAPTTVAVPGTSSLTVLAAVGAKPGFYSVEINGTSSSPAIWHITSVSVLVIGPDFGLSSNPSALTVTAGGSASTSMISMTPVFGFSGTVGLVATSFDPKITATLNPSSVSGAGTSTLSVQAATGTVPGSYYSIKVNGTSGVLTHSIYIPITVIGPDFTVSSNPASITFNAGTQTTATITISPTLGFGSPVDLSVYPSFNLNASISPTPVTSPSYTSTLNVNSTIPGTYSVDVFASSGGIYHDIVIPVTVMGPDFSLSANPTALTIAAGSSKTSAISVNPLNGFSNSVALTVITPAGITASLNPTSITSPTTSTLTINVDPTASPGPYTVDVKGVGGKITRDAFITINVASFTLTASPDALTIAEGASGLSTITVVAVNGFAGTVQLSPSTQPGITTTLSPTSITGSGPSTASIAISSSVSPGTYKVNVTGTSGLLNQKATITVTVPIPDFTLSGPAVVPCIVSTNCPATISVSSLNGFSGVVTFTASTSSPAGLTCTPPPLVTGSGTAPLSCTSNSPGSYTVTVTGTSGSLHHDSGPITYNVVAAQDFTISAGVTSPAAILAGSSGSSTITVSPVGGFVGPIIFSTSTSVGLNCPQIPNWSGSGTVTLTCNSTVAGTYTATLTGTSGSLVHTTTATFNFVDFTVAATSPAAVNAGQSAISTITIASVNGFASPVSFADIVPAGLTCAAITPGGITGSGTATVSCSSTTAGTFTVTVRGTSGSLVHTATATFNFADFGIAASSPSAVNPGQSATSTITVTALNGFAGVVTLTDAVPAGLTCGAIAPGTVTNFGTATVSCSATVAGDYAITFTGTAMVGGLPVYHTTAAIVFHVMGFSMAASPTIVPVTTNTAGTSTITITKISQFNGVVTLSPNNLGCSVTPATVTGSGTATLSCNFTSTGTKTVEVTASSGALSLIATVTFTVTAPTPNFTVAATTPASFTSGGSSTSTVTLTAQNGFYNNVDLTYTVSPSSGLTISFNPNSFAYGSGTSTATFSSSTPGTYTVTITGKSGSLSHSATVTVTVTAAPQPTAPTTTAVLGLDPTLFYGLVGGIVAIAIVGGAVVFMRGKKPQAK